jgi:hypothetical protein
MGATIAGVASKYSFCEDGDYCIFTYHGGNVGWGVEDHIQAHSCVIERQAAQVLVTTGGDVIEFDTAVSDVGRMSVIASFQAKARRPGQYRACLHLGIHNDGANTWVESDILSGGVSIIAASITFHANSKLSGVVDWQGPLVVDDTITAQIQFAAGTITTSTAQVPRLTLTELR